MKLIKFGALLLALCMLVSFAGCGKKDKEEPVESQDTSEYPVEFDDVRIAEQPTTVVSLSPALTEILGDLGYASRLTGVSDFCDFPDAAASLPKMGTAQLPKFDELEEMRPQVVFTSAKLAEKDLIRFQQMDAEVVVLRHAGTMEELKALYVTLGTVMEGKTTGAGKAQTLFDEQAQTKLDAIRTSIEGYLNGGEKVRGVYLRFGDLGVATGDTLEGNFLKDMGMENPADGYGDWVYPADKLAEFTPQVVFYDSELNVEAIKASEVYKSGEAVAQDRLYPVNAIVFERQGLRMFAELEKMVRLVYPDALEPLPEEEIPSNSDASAEEPAEPEIPKEGQLELPDDLNSLYEKSQ